MNDFFIGIFRVAELPEPLPLEPLKERYIALVNDPVRARIWFTSDTLFGLKKELGTIYAGDWEKIEKDVHKTGYSKFNTEASEEEKLMRQAALTESRA